MVILLRVLRRVSREPGESVDLKPAWSRDKVTGVPESGHRAGLNRQGALQQRQRERQWPQSQSAPPVSGGCRSSPARALPGQAENRLPSERLSTMRFTQSMKIAFDRALILGIALCFILGHLGAADRLSGVAFVLLIILAVRLLGSMSTWAITGR